ncbi:efflux transporter outer membrane subunit [Persicimonas caeni]|uniref:Efflux transporter outer membrane subunit n=2 Tax=Persicimonas caeni TaxID=2292766 RepID=A0A4Y6PVE2_PERCE|nr:efflux transporter outer membrane subunit [Persicimonas caeni]QED33435.1 efflux transporter outer membrane subunit [Persicimonas caeni]
MHSLRLRGMNRVHFNRRILASTNAKFFMSRPPRARKSLFLLGTICLLSAHLGCSSTQYADKADEVVEAPDGSTPVDDLGADRWCSDFGQPGLDTTVERAWAGNMQLKAAWARLEQAEALAEIAEAPLWPTLAARAEAEYQDRQFGGAGISTSGGGPEPFWQISAAAAYEVDIWGRHRHRAKAADLEAEAAEAQARALAITLTSEVAEAWFDVIAQRERLELLEAQLKVSEDILAIIKQRLRRGLAGALDAAQQEANVESLRGQVSEARGLLETSQNRLAVLVGEPPEGEDFVDAATLPAVEPIADAGVPANLLERRPDVRASYLLLEAADERTAAAVADRLPRLQLTASIGFQAEQLAKLFEQLFWSIGAGISQSLFEGGRLRAEVEFSEAVAKEQLYLYADTLLEAMREVRDALVLEANQRERIESLRRELDIAESVVDLARKRYSTGAVEYLRVLTGLQELQQVQRALITARRQQLSNRISLCRALGGSWVEDVEPSIQPDD